MPILCPSLTEKSAIDKAAAVFHITPARRSKLVVTKIVVPLEKLKQKPRPRRRPGLKFSQMTNTHPAADGRGGQGGASRRGQPAGLSLSSAQILNELE